MRIEVVGKDESSNAQARTYARYRLFATLDRYRQRVRGARIILRWGKRIGTCDTVVCAVIVALDPSGTVRARAREGHAYAAINRTVERIGHLTRRRSQRDVLQPEIDASISPLSGAELRLDRVASGESNVSNGHLARTQRRLILTKTNVIGLEVVMMVSPRERLLARIRAEYLEMPGLRLTHEQMQRLCGVERAWR